MGPNQKSFYYIMRKSYPVFYKGISDARKVHPEMVDKYFELVLSWAVKEFGFKILYTIAKGYSFFSHSVNKSQLRYEKENKYRFSSFRETNKLYYQNHKVMKLYFWGVFAILFCWPHYVALVNYYLKNFLCNIKIGSILEIAPGHGVWGLLALFKSKTLSLEGWDISPTSLKIAPVLAAGCGCSNRVSYILKNVCKEFTTKKIFQGAICCFLVEHLEQPKTLFESLFKNLKNGSYAFVTAALTAAQDDHIYEFKQENEAIKMAKSAGFCVVKSKIFPAKNIIKDAKYVPKVQALILRKPISKGDHNATKYRKTRCKNIKNFG